MKQEIEKINAEFAVMLGRINGIHAGLLSIARCLPKEVASVAATEVLRAAEAVHADALSTPIPDATVQEMHRVQFELAYVLRAAASTQ